MKYMFKNIEGFLASLEAEGWFLTFHNLENKVSVMLNNEFYFTMERPSLIYLRGKVNGKLYQLIVSEIGKYLGLPIVGDTTYLENVIKISIQGIYSEM